MFPSVSDTGMAHTSAYESTPQVLLYKQVMIRKSRGSDRGNLVGTTEPITAMDFPQFPNSPIPQCRSISMDFPTWIFLDFPGFS